MEKTMRERLGFALISGLERQGVDPTSIPDGMAILDAILDELAEPDAGMMKASADSGAWKEVAGIIAVHAMRTGTKGLSVDPLPKAFTAMIRSIRAGE